MTARLRRAHARIWMFLPFVLALVFIGALLARRTSTPVNSNLEWRVYR